jgi:hypothetical protein
MEGACSQARAVEGRQAVAKAPAVPCRKFLREIMIYCSPKYDSLNTTLH